MVCNRDHNLAAVQHLLGLLAYNLFGLLLTSINTDIETEYLNCLISDTLGHLLGHTTKPKSLNSNCITKMGKLLFFLYNCVQITLEMTPVVLVARSYSFQWKGKS